MRHLVRTGCVQFTRWLPLWTLGLGILGYIYPPLLTWISKSFINWFFALTMFGIGLTLDLGLFIPTLKGLIRFFSGISLNLLLCLHLDFLPVDI
jgi:predicted Na+-dependent transporter